ncbi:MAG: hypothetical protein HIU91_05475 [Acidobacteria bacterium]|nr:hypothetical protein [Acidobacteriota bacterium]
MEVVPPNALDSHNQHWRLSALLLARQTTAATYPATSAIRFASIPHARLSPPAASRLANLRI